MDRSTCSADFVLVNANAERLDGSNPSSISILFFSMVLAALLTSGGLLASALPAGAQSQTPTCRGHVATIVGTPGADVLRGTPGRDVIVAMGGNDVVYGLGGNDVICGGRGDDKLYGGDGADVLVGFKGADLILGGRGHDHAFGGKGADEIHGNRGRDTLRGGPGVDELRGGRHRDTLRGGISLDVLYGGTEHDACESPGDILSECESGGGVRSGAFSTASLSDQFANEMFRLINVERAKAGGLAPLTRDRDLDQYAQAWSVTMSQQPLPLTRLRHHSPAFTGANIDFRDIPDTTNWTHAFENVGYSQIASGDSVRSVMSRLFYSPNGSGFTTSPGHQCNILETGANEVGVGAYVDSHGALWVAQLFWGTNDPAPEPVADCISVVKR